MRVLLYAPVNLNLIDGSAIWCASVAQMLCHDPDLSVDVLLHAPLERTINVGGFAAENRICLLDPWQPDAHGTLGGFADRLGRRLTPAQAFQRVERLHADESYDLLVLRGGPITRLVAAVPRLAARAWFYLTQTGTDYETIEAVSHSNGRIACQTPLLQEYLEAMLGTAPQRYVPLPPMVPRLLCDGPRAARRGQKLCYVGKFDPHYLVEETMAAFTEVRAQFPDAEFVVAGDKFHDPDQTGEFEPRLSAALQRTPGVAWRGGLSREEVGQLMSTCDVGCCWRSAHYDGSLELSTKVLEYAAAGLPVLLNPSRVNRLVFGDDYPLYVDGPESVVQRLTAALEDDDVYRQAAERMFETARRFTFAAVARHLQPWLGEYRRSAAAVPRQGPLRIAFAGHDLKFAREIIDHFRDHPDCVVRVDQWHNHARHDEPRSEELVRWADVVYCEWCLGNAVWYSQRLRPAQRLIVRLHLQERATAFPDQVIWENVDHLVFIAPHVQHEILERIGADAPEHTHLIYNVIECARFARPKPAGSERVLGMIGYAPLRKQPRIALDILAALVRKDPAWRLHLAGSDPREYEWLWKRLEERAYYEELEDRMAGELAGHLVQQGWTDDAAGWYADVGFVLSCSDFEGSHQAIPEGMAAGCVPVVRRWAGAAELYPHSLLFDGVEEAVAQIEAACQPGELTQRGEQGRAEARRRFDKAVILPQLEPLFLEATAPRPAVARAAGILH